MEGKTITGQVAASDSGGFRLGIATYHILLDYLTELGLDRFHCMEASGVTPDVLDDPEADIDVEQELALIRLLGRERGNAALHGVEVGKRQGITTYGVWGLGVMSAANGILAAQWGGRYAPVAFSFVRYRWRLAQWGPLLLMDDRHLPVETRQFLIARDLASFWAIHQDLLPAQPVAVSELWLDSMESQARTALEELYQRPVVTGRPRNGLVMDASVLQTPLARANPVTQGQCERYCRELIRRRRLRLSLSDQVREFLQSRDENLPTLTEVAARFHRSERSLRRQLALEGTGWRSLRDSVFAGQARKLLQWSGQSVEQVAAQLGYSDPSNFSHAFKRWTGMSPAQFRRAQGHGVRKPAIPD